MRCCRIFCLSLLLCATPAMAQTVDSTEEAFAQAQGGAAPPYVVPVLRLVSKTHVEPTTGLVLSNSGLVLVPAGFASVGDEIVVLDGGTDIVSNGRTARIERNFPMDGLQVLSVYGLQRPGAPFADVDPADGDEVRLNAFPPAEQIAEGAQPLDVPTRLTVFGDAAPAVSGDMPLPNVTGPLLDGCGNVAAFSIANGIQTMETSPGTRYQWRSTLLGVIERLGVRPSPTACRDAEEPPTDEPEDADGDSEQKPAEAPAQAEPEPEVLSEPDRADPERAEVRPEETLDLDILPPIEADEPPEPETPPEAEEPAEPVSAWPWLLLALLLIGSGIALHFWRRSPDGVEEEENGTAESRPEDTGDATDPAPALDSRIVLSGQLADGTTIEAECPVAAGAVNVVIGRGQAELAIASAAVSRRHAALNGSAGSLTIADLGSANGTSINGVPCLEGEIMYLEPGDTIILGDARFTLELLPANGNAGE
jgi:hypothetical protein